MMVLQRIAKSLIAMVLYHTMRNCVIPTPNTSLISYSLHLSLDMMHTSVKMKECLLSLFFVYKGPVRGLSHEGKVRAWECVLNYASPLLPSCKFVE